MHLMEWFSYIWFILISSIVSALIYFRKGYPLYLKVFSVYLLLTFAIEYIGSIRSSQGLPTLTLYNSFSTFEFVFLFWMLYHIVLNRTVKRILKVNWWLFPALVILNKLFLQKGAQFHTITYGLGSLVIVMAAISYFFELFRLEKPVKLTREPSFWICSGLLFFYASTFPLYAVLNLLKDPSNIILRNISSILSITNIFLYSSFIVAALCRIKIMKSFS